MNLSELLYLNQLYLHSNHIFVYDSWLTECLEYFLTSHTNNFEEIRTKVIEQWLLNDLTEISPGCLPDNLKNDNTSELKDVYTLQIQFISNFDHFYGYEYSKKEINRAGQHDLENRNLLLTLTDGVQEIFGCVLNPIKDLWINTVPGCKMIIKGPVNFDKYNDLRFLTLNDDNCELLGGEVESLMSRSYVHTVNQLNLLKIQSPDLAVTATDRPNGYVGRTSEQPVEICRRRKRSDRSVGPDNKRIKTEAVNNSADLAVTAIYRHNGYVGRTSEQPVEICRRRKRSDRSVGPDNKRIKTEAVNNSLVLCETVDLTGEKSAVDDNSFIDLTRNDYGSGGRPRRPGESARKNLTIFERQYPHLSFILKPTK